MHRRIMQPPKGMLVDHTDGNKADNIQSHPIEAARAYDRAAVAWLGEFARVNLPRDWPPEQRAQVHAEWQEARKREAEEAGTKEGKGKADNGKRKTA